MEGSLAGLDAELEMQRDAISEMKLQIKESPDNSGGWLWGANWGRGARRRVYIRRLFDHVAKGDVVDTMLPLLLAVQEEEYLGEVEKILNGISNPNPFVGTWKDTAGHSIVVPPTPTPQVAKFTKSSTEAEVVREFSKEGQEWKCGCGTWLVAESSADKLVFKVPWGRSVWQRVEMSS